MFFCLLFSFHKHPKQITKPLNDYFTLRFAISATFCNCHY